MTQTTTERERAEWWTVQEVAAHFRVSPKTILRRIKSKVIPAQVSLGHPRIHASVVRLLEMQALPKASPLAATGWRRKKWEQVPDEIGDLSAAPSRTQRRRAVAG